MAAENSDEDSKQKARRAPRLTSSSFLNSFKSVAPHTRSTGLRTAQLRFNSFGEDRTDVAADFLLNSCYRRGDREFEHSVLAYFQDPALVMLSRIGEQAQRSGTIALPPPLTLPMALHEAIARRRSQRKFSGEWLDLEQLATLLQCGGGVTARASTELASGDLCDLPLRAAPSGGGLYPVDICFGVSRVNGLHTGLYRFLNRESAVVPFPRQHGDEFGRLCAGLAGAAFDVNQVAAIVVLAIRPWRSNRKYGARGLRFTLMEVGYISENIHLAATALGTPSCDWGGFYDDELNALFGFDGVNETVIHVILLGG